MLTSLLFILLATLLPQVIGPGSALLVVFATTVGVLAGLLQTLGLIRWSFLVPLLVVLFLITVFPPLVTWLPNLVLAK